MALIFELSTPREVQWQTYKEIKKGFPDVRRAIEAQTADYNHTLTRLSEHEAEIMRDSLAQQMDEYKWTLTRLSEDQAETMRDSMAQVCGSLDWGFKHLGSRVEEGLWDLGERLSYDLHQLWQVLDWGFTMVVNQLKVANILTENIALLLRIPDMQKERRYYTEQGLKHYRNAVRNKDLYTDALKNLLKAETLEETDYFVLFHIGLVYLYGPATSLSDLDKAKAYLLKAAKYAAVESDPEACRLADLLVGNPRTGSLDEQQPSIESVQKFAADCFRHAAITYYIQGRFVDALKYSEKSAAIAPHYLEGIFTHAKMLAAAGQEERAADVLSGVIDQDRAYALKAAMDPDLGTKPAVLAKLEEHRLRARDASSAAISKAKSEVSSLANLLSQTEALNVSPTVGEECRVKAGKLIEQAQTLFQRQTLFSLLESAEACNFAATCCHEGRQACIATLADLQSNLERRLNSLEHLRTSADQAMKDLKHAVKAAMDPDLATKPGVLAKLEEHRLRARGAASVVISRAKEQLSNLAGLQARARGVGVSPPSMEECRLRADKLLGEAQTLFSRQTYFSLLESSEACNAAMKLCLEGREACVEVLRALEGNLQRKLDALHQTITQNMNMELRRKRLKEDADILAKGLEGSYRFSGGLGCLFYFGSYVVYSMVAVIMGSLANVEGDAIMGILMLGFLVSAVPVVAMYFHYEEKRKSIPERQNKIRKKLEADTRRMEKECSDYIEARFAREGKELQSTLQAVQDTLAGRVAMSLPAGDEVTTQESPPVD